MNITNFPIYEEISEPFWNVVKEQEKPKDPKEIKEAT